MGRIVGIGDRNCADLDALQHWLDPADSRMYLHCKYTCYTECMDIQYALNGDLFVWDAAKAATNLHKHGVRFEEAASVFAETFLC